MAKLSDQQRDLLRLILRSPGIGDGWRQVSKILWPHVVTAAHPELIELDAETQRIRLTPEGEIVMRYLA